MASCLFKPSNPRPASLSPRKEWVFTLPSSDGQARQALSASWPLFLLEPPLPSAKGEEILAQEGSCSLPKFTTPPARVILYVTSL